MPSPTTCPGIRRETATSWPFTTSIRWSWPTIIFSTTTLRLISCACAKAVRTCSGVVRLMATPRPWLPLYGLTTTG